MVVVEEQDYFYSDSDSDDEDVDRYVFLARQPDPAGRHAEDDDRDASSASDDDDDDGDGGDDGTAGLELIIALPMAAPNGSESNLASSSPRRAGTESGSEGSHEKAHEHRAPRAHADAKNATKKKRAAYSKQSRSPGDEADGDRDGVAAAKSAGASSGATATSGRFPCSLCDRCFDSHQALGGHVLGHRKRTKMAIAAGAVLDAVDACEESDAVKVTEEAAKSIAQINKKVLVVSRRGKANGDGSSDEGKTVDDAAEHGDEDVDRARHKRQRKVHGKGNTISHGFTDGNFRSDDDGKMDIGTACPNQKVGGDGRGHEGANGNGNGNV